MQFADAFAALDLHEPANYLVSLAESGRLPGEDEEEVWLQDNIDDWAMAISDYIRDNNDEFFEIIDEDYEVAPGNTITILSGIMAAVFLGFMTIIALTQTILIYWLYFLLVFVIASPLLALVLYGLFWKLAVKGDVLMIRRPLRRRRALPIDEITKVKLKHNRLIIYARGKRALTVRKQVSYYLMLVTQLSLAGKLEESSLHSFTIHQQKANIITALMWPGAAAVFLVASLSRKVNPANVYEIVLLSSLVAIALLYAIFIPWRKIVVDDFFITAIKMLGTEKVWPVSSVTRVRVHSDRMTLYADNKRVADITFRCDGSQELFARLKSRQDVRLEQGKG